MGDGDDKKKEKSRRPGNTAFRQQRLKAWQPILTPKTVLPLFFIVGIIFAPIGGLLLWASSKVEEIVLDYTDCIDDASGEFKDMPSSNVRYSFRSGTPKQAPRWETFNRTIDDRDEPDQICRLEFEIPNALNPPVFFYYRLTNFYQNHRRYVKSVDERQLKGEAVSLSALRGSDACSPLITDPDTDKPYYPCGLIANSLFNDTFSDPVWITAPGKDNETYAMTEKGIAWKSDKDRYKKSKYRNDDVMPPPNWRKQYPDGYTEKNPIPDLSDREDFQVWMRTAGLPTFSKLAKRNNTASMGQGTYIVEIVDNFNVKLYGGTKSIVITTTTVMGGKNPFLGIAYIVVGGLCVLLGTIFAARHLIKPRKLGDHTYLSWNNEPNTATASGRDVRGE
ncbi:LEM3/CDC50 family protein [Kalaharituber pfeilii]|nr:LEM3/CDC50 family protein [Kalaharituber pfeilii]